MGKSPQGEYKVHLNLKRSVEDDVDKVEAMFSGSGDTPHGAIRDASKEARGYFTNLNGEFSNHSPTPPENGSSVEHKNNENGAVIENDSDSNKSDNNCELKIDNIENDEKEYNLENDEKNDDNNVDQKSDITDDKSLDDIDDVASYDEKEENDSHVEDI